jgi:hypothetical protein
LLARLFACDRVKAGGDTVAVAIVDPLLKAQLKKSKENCELEKKNDVQIEGYTRAVIDLCDQQI